MYFRGMVELADPASYDPNMNFVIYDRCYGDAKGTQNGVTIMLMNTERKAFLAYGPGV